MNTARGETSVVGGGALSAASLLPRESTALGLLTSSVRSLPRSTRHRECQRPAQSRKRPALSASTAPAALSTAPPCSPPRQLTVGMTWTPVTDEERAYYGVPKPAPALISELLHRPEPAGDPTWGRGPLPRAPDEARIRATHGHRDGKVWLDEHRKDEWVAYQVWEPTKGSQDRGARVSSSLPHVPIQELILSPRQNAISCFATGSTTTGASLPCTQINSSMQGYVQRAHHRKA